MSPTRLIACLALSSLIAAFPAHAQKGVPDYKPSVGQPGKDVIWVPTPQALVDKMLDMAKATPRDFVMDLGSGDGRTVITAARRGIRAMGVEYDANMVELSRRNAEKEGVADKARFVKQDLFRTDLSKATVITMFLLPALNIKLRPKLLDLKPGTRIVSNSFDMGDWEADETAILDAKAGCEGYCTARLWIVPARVAGTHKTGQGRLHLEQEYQKVHGTLTRAGRKIAVEGKVVGEEVVLKAEGQELRARLNGKRLQLARA